MSGSGTGNEALRFQLRRFSGGGGGLPECRVGSVTGRTRDAKLRSHLETFTQYRSNKCEMKPFASELTKMQQHEAVRSPSSSLWLRENRPLGVKRL